MATSSVYQNILVKDKRSIQRLVDALERSKDTPAKEVTYSRSVDIVEDEDTIRKMFGVEYHDGIQAHND